MPNVEEHVTPNGDEKYGAAQDGYDLLQQVGI